ncbi:MAG TPA: RpiB/LacA/LacB family sugar-phosphate isomerase, partial [Actinomycetota bacterium]|nr:RpiB/LacA/LacB family sugar-phosphate isomerase [Actinomycetota bacterium]
EGRFRHSSDATLEAMKIAAGADDKTDLTDYVLEELRARGHELIAVLGPAGGRDEQWADVGRGVAEVVARGDADQGVVFCWTGTGVSLAATRCTARAQRSAPMPSRHAARACTTTRTSSR